MMKIQHLRAFAAVIESGGVVAASGRLHASQPTVSAALRSLEEELGEPLFHRRGGGRRLVPTAKALRFHRHAADILRRCDAARAEFRARGDEAPRLCLGVLPTLASRDVAAVAVALGGGEPGWRFQLREGDGTTLADCLRRGRVDVAWTSVESDTEHARVVWREDFVVAVGPGHRLARHQKTGVAPRDLDGERLVLRGSCELRSGRLRESGVALPTAARATRDELALSLVAVGVGIAIVPRSLVSAGLVVVPVENLGIQRSVGLAWHPDIAAHLLTATLDAVNSQARAAGLIS